MPAPDAKQSIVGVLMLALTILSGYLGYDKYEASQGPAPAVEVNIASMPATAVVSQNDINQLINNAIAAAVRKQDAKNAAKFPTKESWQ